MGDVSVIAQAIGTGKAIAVSDGSFKDGCGAAAWIIEGAEATNHIQGACLEPGTTDDHSAYQSELTGILGIMLTIYDLQEQEGVIMGSLQICCNGKLALGRAASSSPVSVTEPHSDLITAIRNLRDKIKWTLTFQHVLGHQNKGYPTVLSSEAMLNVDMDIRAKAKLAATAGTVPLGIPFEGWACYIGPTKIVKQ